jgi:hypothetical protein
MAILEIKKKILPLRRKISVLEGKKLDQTNLIGKSLDSTTVKE